MFYGSFFCYYFTYFIFFFLKHTFSLSFLCTVFLCRWSFLLFAVCCSVFGCAVNGFILFLYVFFLSISVSLSLCLHLYYKWIICSFMTIKLLIRHFIKWICFSAAFVYNSPHFFQLIESFECYIVWEWFPFVRWWQRLRWWRTNNLKVV